MSELGRSSEEVPFLFCVVQIRRKISTVLTTYGRLKRRQSQIILKCVQQKQKKWIQCVTEEILTQYREKGFFMRICVAQRWQNLHV